jgi:glycerate 2-kinase
MQLHRDALAIFHAALHAADARNAIQNHLCVEEGVLVAGEIRISLDDVDRIFVIAVGKAAAGMATAVEEVLGSRLNGGILVTKHGHLTAKPAKFNVFETSHPIPDQAGVDASAAVAELAKGLGRQDLLIVALSGGASALLAAPAEPLTLEDKQFTTDLLLRAGADIAELNCLRKHLSTLKGGRLAALAHPATVVSLLLSDVIGNPIDVIASGPTAPDRSSFIDAFSILRKFELIDKVPVRVRSRIESGMAGKIAETPKPDDPMFDRVHHIIVGSNELALEAATNAAKSLGYKTHVISSAIQGEASEMARRHTEILKRATPPACLLSGGETTVTVAGNGKGGRNQEFALAAALEIAGVKELAVLSAGTDGTDGPTDAAGAFVTGDTVERARSLGLAPDDYLLRHDSYTFFEALGDLIKTGPTGTNVMDIHIMLAGRS